MQKKLLIPFILGLLLTVLVSYSFAQCNVQKQITDQKANCCQCCCCNCAK